MAGDGKQVTDRQNHPRSRRGAHRTTTLPPPLQRGDTIGIAAPAGCVTDLAALHQGADILREMGFTVTIPPETSVRDGYLAGSDHRRAEAFMKLWLDPDVKAVIAARGGYGCLRLAGLLDLAVIRKKPKLFVGFSDITVLLSLFTAQARITTIHGPVAATLRDSDPESIAQLSRLLSGQPDDTLRPAGLDVLRPGKAVGRITGGNLSTLTHLVGTPFEPDYEQALLLLEDCNEPAFRVDRMLTHLAVSGRLAGIAGVILGDFSGEQGEEALATAKKRILELTRAVPVWAGFPIGHGRQNIPLPMGLPAEMDSAAATLRILYPAR